MSNNENNTRPLREGEQLKLGREYINGVRQRTGALIKAATPKDDVRYPFYSKELNQTYSKRGIVSGYAPYSITHVVRKPKKASKVESSNVQESGGSTSYRIREKIAEWRKIEAGDSYDTALYHLIEEIEKMTALASTPDITEGEAVALTWNTLSDAIHRYFQAKNEYETPFTFLKRELAPYFPERVSTPPPDHNAALLAEVKKVVEHWQGKHEVFVPNADMAMPSIADILKNFTPTPSAAEETLERVREAYKKAGETYSGKWRKGCLHHEVITAIFPGADITPPDGKTVDNHETETPSAPKCNGNCIPERGMYDPECPFDHPEDETPSTPQAEPELLPCWKDIPGGEVENLIDNILNAVEKVFDDIPLVNNRPKANTNLRVALRNILNTRAQPPRLPNDKLVKEVMSAVLQFANARTAKENIDDRMAAIENLRAYLQSVLPPVAVGGEVVGWATFKLKAIKELSDNFKDNHSYAEGDFAVDIQSIIDDVKPPSLLSDRVLAKIERILEENWNGVTASELIKELEEAIVKFIHPSKDLTTRWINVYQNSEGSEITDGIIYDNKAQAKIAKVTLPDHIPLATIPITLPATPTGEPR